MVDDRAESRRAFDFPDLRADGWRSGVRERVGGWFAPRARHDGAAAADYETDHGAEQGVRHAAQRGAQHAAQHGDEFGADYGAGYARDTRAGWLAEHRLPLAISAIWLGGLGIYAAGYAARMNDLGGGPAFPALDLLFFAFAAIGPVAMLWMVWLLQARAARLTEAVGAQSESALAVAATLANLHDAVDGLAENTTARLADASARVERQSGATLARVDRATTELAGRLETAMLETVRQLDETLRARASRFESSLDAQRDALARRLDDEAERLSRTVEAETRNLASVQETLSERISAGFAENGARFDRDAADLLGSLKGRVDAVGERAEQALSAAAAELSAAQAARHRDLDEGFARRKTALTHSLHTASRIVEGEIVPLIAGLRERARRDARAPSPRIRPPAPANWPACWARRPRSASAPSGWRWRTRSGGSPRWRIWRAGCWPRSTAPRG